MSEQIVAVSRPGHNVLTETDPNNLIFSSKYNTFKILLTGTVSMTSSAGSDVTTNVSHNLGKVTGFLLLWNLSGKVRFHDARIATYGTDGTRVTSSGLHTLSGYNTTNTLTIDYFSQVGSNVITVRYYIFEVATQ